MHCEVDKTLPNPHENNQSQFRMEKRSGLYAPPSLELSFVPKITCMRLTNGATLWVWSALRASSVQEPQQMYVCIDGEGSFHIAALFYGFRRGIYLLLLLTVILA